LLFRAGVHGFAIEETTLAYGHPPLETLMHASTSKRTHTPVGLPSRMGHAARSQKRDGCVIRGVILKKIRMSCSEDERSPYSC
jgi:hypothetical protein